VAYESKPVPMNVEYGGPDKVQIVAHPRLQPATCILCGAPGDGRPFVDIGCFIEWYGAVYFCSYCIVDISNHLGYYSPEQYDLTSRTLAATTSENHILADANEHLRGIVANILNLSVSESDDFVRLFNEFKVWRDAQTSPDANVSGPREDDEGVIEQTASEGRISVPDDSSSGQLEFNFDE
jgi:hypothetical protein